MSDLDRPRQPLPGIPDPDRPGWNTLVQLTPEQTARWFAEGDEAVPWSQGLVDPEMRAQFARQKAALRGACDKFCDLLAPALERDSPHSARRLRELRAAAAAVDGDPNACRLLAAMLSELVKFGLSPDA